MPDWIRVSDAPNLSSGSGVTAWVDDVELAIFRVDDEWLGIDGRCPHQGASLADGSVEDGRVACSWHGWQFDLRTGAGSRAGSSVRTFPVRVDDEGLWIDREPLTQTQRPAAPVADGIHRFVVRYGTLGWVGVFGTVDQIDSEHRDRVVVQTDRGTELGEVLSAPSSNRSLTAKPTGEVQRVANAAEIALQTERQSRVSALLAAAAVMAQEKQLALDIIDGEILFDGETAVLYYLGEFHADFAVLRTHLALDFQLSRVDLHPLVEPEAGGCGKPGCGGGGCG